MSNTDCGRLEGSYWSTVFAQDEAVSQDEVLNNVLIFG